MRIINASKVNISFIELITIPDITLNKTWVSFIKLEINLPECFPTI